MTPDRVLEIAVVKDMFGKALRRGFDELSKWAEQRHVERGVDLGLDFWDAEAAVFGAIAEEIQHAGLFSGLGRLTWSPYVGPPRVGSR